MIEVTRMNGLKMTVNCELLLSVEETPDTLLTFTTGQKMIVRESRQEIVDLVKSYKREIIAGVSA
ncbi:MAG: flagellar FlbD family protein [Lachnospiraceae bacterium]|jgi:flagellar protein FlbD|nr:flagellar FlbD family protein [Lachnospiraceae bacterium]